MRDIILLILSILWFKSETSYGSKVDSWYLNDDDGFLDSVTPISFFRSKHINISYQHNQYGKNSLRNKQYGEQWNLQFERYDPKADKLKQFLRNQNRDVVLENLQKTSTMDELRLCYEGQYRFFECNYCVCMGGQIYVCTAIRCKGSNNQLKTYREKRERECIEGEEIVGMDSCNVCWCSFGQIVCTWKNCSHYDAEVEKCKPGEYVPSPDGCNTCGCNYKGDKYCTTRACTPLITENKEQNVGCVAKTWFSISGSSTCKECFCINNKYAFCYMKLCLSEYDLYGYEAKMIQVSLSKSSICTKGAVTEDECSKCTCTYKQEWKCYTKMNSECSGPAPVHRPKFRKSYLNRLKISRTGENEDVNRPAANHGSHAIDNPEEKETHEDDHNVEASTTEKPINSIEGPTKATIINEDQSDHDTETNYSDEDIDITTRKPKRPTKRPNKNNQRPKKPKKSKKTTKRPYYDYYDVEEYYDNNEEDYEYQLPPEEAPNCHVGDAFTQGSLTSCQGCVCTNDDRWKCWSSEGTCYDDIKDVKHNQFIKNKLTPCSVCFWGPQAKVCATDEVCANKLKQGACNNEKCSKKCTKRKKYNYGFCLRDNCKCIK